ncbi:PadR family transcriptional regulator [Tumebacillus avium]|nr:PadR family transcriptional regulator [Tumebacillus avium]
MNFDKEVLKGYIDIILLSMLADRPKYGFELAKQARETSGGSFEMKEATLYIALKRLEKQGYATSFWEDSISGGGRRKYYRLTEEGLARVRGKKQEWEYLKGMIDRFLKEVEL